MGGSFIPTGVDPDRCIFNFSNYVLKEREKFLLSLGLGFGIPYFKFPKVDISLRFEHFFHRLAKQSMYGNGGLAVIVNGFKRVINELPKYLKYNYNVVNKDDVNILKRLRKLENLVICRADKGNGTVLLNRNDYIDKMNNILNDHSKFKRIENEDIFKVNLNLEDRINYQLRNMKTKGIISENEYNSLYITGSSPSVMYGLPKVHKEGIPLRPILAAYSTPSCKLSKYLLRFIQPFTVNEYTLNNSYEFKDLMNSLNFSEEVFMVSFDISSLFTNVLVIVIIINIFLLFLLSL